ncbi:hypothetical protein EP7_003167 [Isosphaeraceae bacterium EP7]
MTIEEGPAMPNSAADRGFRLTDAMVMISLAAIGLAMAVKPYEGMDRQMIIVIGGFDARAWSFARYYGSLAYPCITPLTLALPLLALRRPRPPLSRLFLRPGLGGCVAASVALLLRGLESLPHYLADMGWHQGPIEPWVLTGEKVGYSVLGVWAMLAVAGRWRIGPGWLERVAILVGSLWAAGAVGSVAVVLRTRWG